MQIRLREDPRLLAENSSCVLSHGFLGQKSLLRSQNLKPQCPPGCVRFQSLELLAELGLPILGWKPPRSC